MTKEAQIEKDLITKLDGLKYIYRDDIRTNEALEQNFREKFNALNRVTLSDSEYNRLREKIVNPDVFAASKMLREVNTFFRDDDTPLQYTLVNIKDWCKNDFEVVNQLRMDTEESHHRYDVVLLINGIPAVQVELKTLQVSPRRAMQQIVDYKKDLGNGYTNSLMCFLQLFIVSNRSNTFYFANNQLQHFNFNADEQFLPVYYHADKENHPIVGLHDFADDFLTKCKLGQMISRYMVLVVSEQKMMVMRPYQIYAVKAIVDSIEQNRGNGYIWHTTGSGKTLTSFKASTLLKDNDDIHKCLFVVDRKDLDRQTREEFNKFQEGCVEQNTNTASLVSRMLSDDYANKVIVTTIQKLGLALNEDNKKNYKELLKPLSGKRMVFIFDECHRSQFGDNHKAIKTFFPNAQLFGFTGTPIFKENATYVNIEGEHASYKTTKDIFQEELHTYTIADAIDDNNVLKFHVDYFEPQEKGQKKSKKKRKPGEPIPRKAVVEAILSKHDKATHHRRFNAILATASINDAIEYHQLFKELQAQQQAEDADFVPLNIACVFSPPAKPPKNGNKQDQQNVKDIKQLQEDLPQEKKDNEKEPEKKKAALKAIIAVYNKQFNTNHRISEFDAYYQDVQQRIKDHKYTDADYPHHNKVDVTIVVDMLLTGFDSKYLNTLYVDKNLRYHGLIQAFSRTNRILNDSKPYGTICDFRNQQTNVNNAIKLFSGKKKKEAKEIWLVDAAEKVAEKFKKAVAALDKFMKSHKLASKPEEVPKLKGDTARGQFITKFKEIQRLKTRLEQYTNLSESIKKEVENAMPTDQLRSFRSMYIEVANRLKKRQDKGSKEKEAVNQLDFEFVLFASALIDYDYIMSLIAKSQGKPSKEKMTPEQIIELLSSYSNMMGEREDMIAYITQLDFSKGLSEQAIRDGYQTFKADKSARELADIAKRHELEIATLQTFVDGIISRMIFDGEQLTELLSPLELNWKNRRRKEEELMDDLIPLLKKLAEGGEISGLNAYE